MTDQPSGVLTAAGAGGGGVVGIQAGVSIPERSICYLLSTNNIIRGNPSDSVPCGS